MLSHSHKQYAPGDALRPRRPERRGHILNNVAMPECTSQIENSEIEADEHPEPVPTNHVANGLMSTTANNFVTYSNIESSDSEKNSSTLKVISETNPEASEREKESSMEKMREY